ncbi:hypothetical protein LX32DRAFT_652719 [Colletotrichum zoysiae]|uniref:Uncharacterized protein n=1 Tax=Colletotrichum zoysiae TaxID=1216348 RepID=A0AAD9HJ65_9PEZI|nr:hypothetical protein LX32DRAFT_652719 [Colletotrichum zoysiae]
MGPGPTQNLNFWHDGVVYQVSPQAESLSSPNPSDGNTWISTGSMAFQQKAMDELMLHGNDSTNLLPTYSADIAHQGLDFLINSVMPIEGPSLDKASAIADSTESDIRAFFEVNMRAYCATTVSGIPSGDELYAVTQSAAKLIARMAAVAEQQLETESADQGRDHRAIAQNASRMSVGLVLQGLSACEMVYDALDHACAVIQQELEDDTRAGGSREDAQTVSGARAVMTMELMNYLFEKLIRAQKQLLKATLPGKEESSTAPDGRSWEPCTVSYPSPPDSSFREIDEYAS